DRRHQLRRLQAAVADQHRAVAQRRREHHCPVSRGREPQRRRLRRHRHPRRAQKRRVLRQPRAEIRQAMSPKRTRFTGFICLLVPCCLSAPAPAQTVAEFYRGRQITMLVASAAGGGYDTYARAFARHAGKHIPGNPGFIAKNLPAAAGVAAANALANTSERDGSAIAALTNTVAMEPLFGNAAARFDAARINWLGSIGKLQNVCATWHQSPSKTIGAARERGVIVGAAGATSNSAVVPRVLNALIGTRFKVIAGYDPGAGLTLALERGEAEGICGLSWSTIKASRPHWIKDKLLNVIVQMGFERLPELPDVPRALDFVAEGEKRQVLELILTRQEMG